jgi:hypothetical protein
MKDPAAWSTDISTYFSNNENVTLHSSAPKIKHKMINTLHVQLETAIFEVKCLY